MEKKTTITISKTDLTDLLKEKGFITESESISKISLMKYSNGIMLEIEHFDPQWNQKQKEFIDMPVEKMDISVRTITVIRKLFNVHQLSGLLGKDLFAKRGTREWKAALAGKKSIDELNTLFAGYELPVLE